MSEKEAILRAVAGLPDSTNWAAVTDALFRIVARDGTPADVARLHAALTTPEELAEYTNPVADGVPLADVLAELEARGSAG
jgi:hypothetical protein